MQWIKRLLVPVLVSISGLAVFCADSSDKKSEDDTPVKWKKTVIDTAFRSEGVAIGDINKDGKMDIVAGDVWYEAPDWKMHEIRPAKDYRKGEENVYSNCMACWVDDVNGDGWLDVIIVGFPGTPCHWYENPGNKEGHWKEHEIWHSACNETPQYVDLFGNGKRVLVMGWQPKGKDNEGQMAWFAPGKDPTALWEMHPISEPSIPPTYKVTTDTFEKLKKGGVPADVVAKLSGLNEKIFSSEKEMMDAAAALWTKEEFAAHQAKFKQHATIPGKIIPGTFRFSHGLGVGDVNGDGRLDVMCTDGWWEQPEKADGKTPWPFHPGKLSDSCADMFAYDVDGDGKADIISSSAHGYGIWYYLQKPPNKDGHPEFVKTDLFPKLVSQTHAMQFVDINGDGLKDIVTGKRWWAHGPKGDADPSAPATLYWFEAKREKDGMTKFIPHLIDEDSGIGTQFVVADFNGDKLPDIVVANKKGVFLFEQVREKK
jgi:hypothetical protein